MSFWHVQSVPMMDMLFCPLRMSGEMDTIYRSRALGKVISEESVPFFIMLWNIAFQQSESTASMSTDGVEVGVVEGES